MIYIKILLRKREKRMRKSFGSSMDKELLEQLRAISKETGIPLSKLFDRAVQLLIDQSYSDLINNKNDSQN